MLYECDGNDIDPSRSSINSFGCWESERTLQDFHVLYTCAKKGRIDIQKLDVIEKERERERIMMCVRPDDVQGHDCRDEIICYLRTFGPIYKSS